MTSPQDISRWSTDQVAKADRFAYWRESLSANMIGVTPEALAEHRTAFEGEFTRTPVADTGVMRLRMQISQLRTDRSAADIRERPGDGVFLFRAVTTGMNFRFSDREDFEPRKGMTVVGGLDRPRYAVVSEPGEYRCDVLRIPSSALAGLADDPSVLEPRIVAQASGADALLHGFFNSFLRELPRLNRDDATAALSTLTGLTLLSLRRERGKDEPVRDAVKAARLKAARDHIVRHAANPALSPARIAAMLGVSVRQLHMLFEPTGKSFSWHLADVRIERAIEALASEPTRSVAEIAFACGFESLPTFYRTFRAVTGRTPGEMRENRD